MVKKLVLFIILLLFTMSTGNVSLRSKTIAYAQNEKRYKRQNIPQEGDKAQSLTGKLLLEEEKQLPTTAENVIERNMKLGIILSRMIRSGISVKNILPKEKGLKIRDSIRNGDLETAATEVHEAIMKLESQTDEELPAEVRDVKKGVAEATKQQKRPPAASRGRTTVRKSTPLLQLNIHQTVIDKPLNNILKLMNPAIDSEKRRLYFSGTKSNSIGVVDIDEDKLIDTFDIGTPGGFLLVDPKTSELYMFIIGVDQIFKIDPVSKSSSRVKSLPSYLPLPKKGVPKRYKNHTYENTGYPFLAGYLQKENAAYGILKVRNSAGKLVDQIPYGPNALYFAIDEKTGKLYTTNTGDGSISVFDLNNKRQKIKDINVGTSVEEIVLNQQKNILYIRNRVGGSAIYYYDLKSGLLSTIKNENISSSGGIGMWPTQIIYDDGKLYVLSHYAGRVDIIDTESHNVINRLPLDLTYKPRTDSISAMVMDKKRKRLYAVFPELSELAIADAKSLKSIKTIKIKQYDASKFGPAGIVINVDEVFNKLYVYLTMEKILQVYDCDTFKLDKSISINAGKRMHGLIVPNAEKGVIYVGNKVVDAKSLETKQYFPKGQRVIAFDNSKNTLYLVDMLSLGPAKMVEKVYEYQDMTFTRAWTLSPIISVPSSFAFDFENDTFYVGYLESSVIESFDLKENTNTGSKKEKE